MKNIWKQDYTNIFISVKFLGIYWEFWQETYYFGDSQEEFFHIIKDKYNKKFKNREFKMRLYYPNKDYVINQKKYDK